jgi:hypothetical protein
MNRDAPHLHDPHGEACTRRDFLFRTGLGLGGFALAGLLGDEAGAMSRQQRKPPRSVLGGTPGALLRPHWRPRAKRVIFIHLAGSPPSQDLFDFKPLLNTMHMQKAPSSILPERSAFLKTNPKPPLVCGIQHPMRQVGKNGMWMSDLLPHMQGIVDDVCFVRSMQTDGFNHAPAQIQLQTGFSLLGRPSMGAWLSYGLGSENKNLPSFVVLNSGGTPSGGASLWGSGFLPSQHQGVVVRNAKDRVLFLGDPKGMSRASRRRSLDTLRELNEMHHEELGDPETLARVQQYEMAFRMQGSIPGVMDLRDEKPETLERYGAQPGKASFAANCVLARRLAEQGVRFVQLYDRGWDIHGTGKNDDLLHQMPRKCKQVDRPIAALIQDLAQRGLLEDTLVVMMGEFGRTPVLEARNGRVKFLGRDHNPQAFTCMLAGASVHPGLVYGRTDEWGLDVVDKPVHIHDLQATMLAMLGIDHTALTYRFQGLDFRLTNFRGRIVRDLFDAEGLPS